MPDLLNQRNLVCPALRQPILLNSHQVVPDKSALRELNRMGEYLKALLIDLYISDAFAECTMDVLIACQHSSSIK